MQWDQQKISQLFRDAKRAVDGRVPSFEHTLTRARSRSHFQPIAVFAGAAALALAVGLGGTIALRARIQANRSLAELERPPALLEWQSPTAFLLETPGHELRDSLPQAGHALNIRTHQAASTPQRR
jgi:hypothetical protein